MNKWKIAFWVCFTVLLIVTAFSIYTSTNQAFSIVRTSESYSKTVDDLNSISKIINETDLTKNQIRNILKDHKLFSYMDFGKDTVSLDRVNLIFNNNRLVKVTNQN